MFHWSLVGVYGRSQLGLGDDVVIFFFKREVQGCLVIQQVACFQLQSLALVEQAGKQAAEPMPAAGRLGVGKLQELAS